MPTSELTLLIEHSGADERHVIHEAAVAAGLMWKCRACPTAFLRVSEELCNECGRDREGRPLSDVRPGLYTAPDELWERLRTEVADHFRQEAFDPLPEAAAFPWESAQDAAPWSLTELTVHYGGRQHTHLTALEGTELEELLEEVALTVEPGYLEHLRLVLPR
ncbi:hypothetical protein [Streptomyces qinglanensis]|uniref:hypothetical protein n=1 Tax=Streptomyces qinglanensis TaxID=943816 RepID=UPI003D73758C